MEESILQTNKFFGGLKPEVSNVIFIQGKMMKTLSSTIMYSCQTGELDPRRSLSPKENLNPNAPVIVMPGTETLLMMLQ
jgi:hypothetical protein